MRGYLYEDLNATTPIELAEVKRDRGGGSDYVGFTDHNGFYWWTTQYGQDYRLQLFGSRKCQYGIMLGQTEVKKEYGTTLSPNLYAVNKVASYIEEKCNRYLIKGRIKECVTGIGISGISVILSRTAPIVTNSQGEFTVVAHYNNGRG